MRKRMIICAWMLCVSALSVPAAESTDAVQTLISRIASEIAAHTQLTSPMKQHITRVLLPQMTNPVFVAEVTMQNKKQMPLEEIKRIDAAWTSAKDELALQRILTDNTCANEIKRLVATHPVIAEAFVMDNQGANVGQNNITVDYWQGDEAKFINAYHNGQGGVDVGAPALDPSVNEQVQQISLPIINQTGTVIGAVTFCLRVHN